MRIGPAKSAWNPNEYGSLDMGAMLRCLLASGLFLDYSLGRLVTADDTNYLQVLQLRLPIYLQNGRITKTKNNPGTCPAMKICGAGELR